MGGTTLNIPSYWLGLLLLGPSMERRTPTSAMATDLAVAAGMGKGEFAGAFANWRALCVAAAPLLYGTAVNRFLVLRTSQQLLLLSSPSCCSALFLPTNYML